MSGYFLLSPGKKALKDWPPPSTKASGATAEILLRPRLRILATCKARTSGLPETCSPVPRGHGPRGGRPHLVELTQEGALILAPAAVLHPLPGDLVQGGGHSLGTDSLQQTEPVSGGELPEEHAPPPPSADPPRLPAGAHCAPGLEGKVPGGWSMARHCPPSPAGLSAWVGTLGFTVWQHVWLSGAEGSSPRGSSETMAVPRFALATYVETPLLPPFSANPGLQWQRNAGEDRRGRFCVTVILAEGGSRPQRSSRGPGGPVLTASLFLGLVCPRRDRPFRSP